MMENTHVYKVNFNAEFITTTLEIDDDDTSEIERNPYGEIVTTVPFQLQFLILL